MLQRQIQLQLRLHASMLMCPSSVSAPKTKRTSLRDPESLPEMMLPLAQRVDADHELWLLLAAEGYRHIVCLIDNYASSCLVLTKGWGRWSDRGIALEQTCRAVHAWYPWTAEER